MDVALGWLSWFLAQPPPTWILRMEALASSSTHCSFSRVRNDDDLLSPSVDISIHQLPIHYSLLPASLDLPASAAVCDYHPAALHLFGWPAPVGALRLLHRLRAHLCGSHAAPYRSVRPLQALLHDQTGYRINRFIFALLLLLLLLELSWGEFKINMMLPTGRGITLETCALSVCGSTWG